MTMTPTQTPIFDQLFSELADAGESGELLQRLVLDCFDMSAYPTPDEPQLAIEA